MIWLIMIAALILTVFMYACLLIANKADNDDEQNPSKR